MQQERNGRVAKDKVKTRKPKASLHRGYLASPVYNKLVVISDPYAGTQCSLQALSNHSNE